MRQVYKATKQENIIRFTLVIVGILCFSFSSNFGWGFILGTVISKENIHLKTLEGWGLLTLISGVMLFALYFLLEVSAVYGYFLSLISYFLLRDFLRYFQNK